jgi:hypothetical protein
VLRLNDPRDYALPNVSFVIEIAVDDSKQAGEFTCPSLIKQLRQQRTMVAGRNVTLIARPACELKYSLPMRDRQNDQHFSWQNQVLQVIFPTKRYSILRSKQIREIS